MNTTFVYIDSSIFIGKNLDFNGKHFKAFQKLAIEEKIELILTTVTISEVKNYIKREVEQLSQSLKKFRSTARIARNLPESNVHGIFDEMNIDETIAMLQEQFNFFIKSCNAKILDLSQVDSERIFSEYFHNYGPFAEGKKKNEFPDAFILGALREFVWEKKKDIYVVSTDKDFEKAAKCYWDGNYVPSLEAYLELATSHYERLAPLAICLLKENSGELEKSISTLFCDMGFYLGDQKGEVLDVNVIDITNIDQYLISVDERKAEFDITALIKYSAHVMYDNLENAMYDSEEKVLIPFEKIDLIIERKEDLEISVSISFNSEEPHEYRLDTLEIVSPQDDIEVTIDDYYAYK